MYIPVVGRYFTVIVPEGKDKGTYQSNLFSMNVNHLLISKPQLSGGGSTVTLAPGTAVILDYRDSADVPCRFETVVDDLPEAADNILALRCPQSIERQQRRENIRIPVSWPAAITFESETLSASLNDLSGGGFSAWIPSKYRLVPGESVNVVFEMNTGKEYVKVSSQATVVGAKSEEDGELTYLCSFKFVTIQEQVRQRIMEFIYERQILDIRLRNVGRTVVF